MVLSNKVLVSRWQSRCKHLCTYVVLFDFITPPVAVSSQVEKREDDSSLMQLKEEVCLSACLSACLSDWLADWLSFHLYAGM